MNRLISFEVMGKKVLIAPLHWGLGHATRCIPVIQAQLDAGNQVLIAANTGPKALLSARFPMLRFVDIPFMEITYPKDGNMSWHFAKKGFRLIWSIFSEHRKLQSLIREENINLVISDARFGLWTRRCHCVFITHQVNIISPYFEGIINLLNRWVMSKYDEVWIPDYAQKPGLAGKLSHPKKLPANAKYIGPLSRFVRTNNFTQPEAEGTLAIVSGPEPQRSMFEAEIVRQHIESGEKLTLLKGKPEENKTQTIGNITLYPHLDDDALIAALKSHKNIIARSGYSTIMDFHILGVKRVAYYPTPGQTEQEYLAELHSK